jgi:hypothetical protein
MMHLLASSCLILASTVTDVAGFATNCRPSSSSPSVQQQQQRNARTPITALQSSSSTTANDYYNHPTNSPSLLELASQCATSDSCSIDMAELYLREIFHAQSGCIAMTGNYPNVDSQMCENVDVVAEVVANLRNKIASSSIVAQQQAKNLPPLSTVMTAAAIVVAAEMTLLFHANSMAGTASPITMQEMYWAIRDGYIGDVMSHVFHNGGLLVNSDASMVSSTASSLTPQELFWSVRDGYASTVALNSGGGIGDGDSGGNVVLPFTPQEVWWAIQNGYVNDLTVHLFRNGGLLV